MAVLPTASESPVVYACELWVFAMCPALRGSTVSYAGVAHFPKHSLEYSLNFWSPVKKKKKKERGLGHPRRGAIGNWHTHRVQGGVKKTPRTMIGNHWRLRCTATPTLPPHECMLLLKCDRHEDPSLEGSIASTDLSRTMCSSHNVPLVWLLLFIGATLLPLAAGRLVIAGVLPHGDYVFDASPVRYRYGSRALHDAALRLGRAVAAAQPDVILLTTPHGLISDRDFLLYANSNAEGFGEYGGSEPKGSDSAPTYRVHMSVPLNRPRSRELRTRLASRGFNVSGLSGFADVEPLPLRWGEVTPLLFLNTTLRQGTSVIVLSQPVRFRMLDSTLVPELRRLGAAIFREIEAWPERVAAIVSTDLAHTHLATGPYGYSPAALPFEEACGRWAATLNSSELTVVAASYVDRALSCGFIGMVLLDAMVQLAGRGRTGPWVPRLMARAHPTYYGMMVALMSPGTPDHEAAVAARRWAPAGETRDQLSKVSFAFAASLSFTSTFSK